MKSCLQWAGVAAAALATVSNSISAAAPKSATSRVDQVIIVFKTHFDIGYTDMASNVVRRYRTTMIDDALKVVDQNRSLPPEQQFAWTLPGWPLSKILEDWPGQTPDRQRRVQQAFKEGRFVVHALPFTTHTELLEPEDLVRGLGFASRLSRAAGLELPRDAKMTDVPCHSWIMPTLLRHAGVDFLHLGCNAASSSPRVPRLFFWEGPDGSRLLTMYTAESYGTGLVPPRDWPYRTWLALIHTGDNHGPPTPAEVKQLLDEAKVKLPGVKVRIGRLSDFADGILAEKSDIPVIRGDMPDTWIHGPMCDPAGARLAKNVRPAIATAESLHTLLGIWGVRTADTAPAIAKAYEQSLLYGEHTWGGALYWVTKYGSGTKWGYGETWKADHAAGRFKRLEDSWAEHTGYIEAARDLVQPLLEGELRGLAGAVNVPGRRVAVFNPLPWPRDGVVTLPDSLGPVQALQATDSEEVVPLENGSVARFTARGVPALGYRVFVPTERRAQAPRVTLDRAAETFESPFFKARFTSGRGVLLSLVDKRSGRELVNTNAAQGFGQYLYERFDSNQVAAYVKAYVKINADWAVNELGKPSLPPAAQVPYQAVAPGDFKYVYSESPVAARLKLESLDPADRWWRKVSTELILYRQLPWADLEFTVTDKPADPWPEAGWLCLPFKIDSPRFRLGRQGSIIDPVKDIVTGANRNLYGINTGLALFDTDGQGVGVCPMDNPLVSLDEPGCWKYSLDFVPRKPTVYINLFNDQWTTNFRLWNEGTWTARVRLWAFDRYDAESSLVTPSLEARFPLQATVAEGPGGALPATQTGLELSRKGVLVTAFGPNPDGTGLVLRLWENAGQPGRCQVRLPAGLRLKRVRPADLRGRPMGTALEVNDQTFEVPLRPFAPFSCLIEPV
jgi:alpha-mannosidase